MRTGRPKGNKIGSVFINSILVDSAIAITSDASFTFMYEMIFLLGGNVVLVIASIVPFIKLFKSNLKELIQ